MNVASQAPYLERSGHSPKGALRNSRTFFNHTLNLAIIYLTIS